MVEGIDMYACLDRFESGSTPMLQHQVLLPLDDHLVYRDFVSLISGMYMCGG